MKKENRNIIRKYIIRGIAIEMTSKGSLTINSPFNENITTIVNNNDISVIGLIFGINRV